MCASSTTPTGQRLRIERLPPPRAHAHAAEPAGIRHVLYSPARPTPDGRSLLVLSPLDFLAALARLIPPPRRHRHRYHGVLAPHAALRQRVTALATPVHRGPPPPPAPAEGSELAFPAQRAARSRGARLLARIYEVFPLVCPECNGPMRILASSPTRSPRPASSATSTCPTPRLL